MSNPDYKYRLPKEIDRNLAALSKLYAQDGHRQLQEIIVNAQVRIHEEWSADSWNGGTYGHALYLVIPSTIFLGAAKSRGAIQKQIKEDINNIHNVQNEFIEEVFLEMEADKDLEWRKKSGVLLASKREVSPDAKKRIWGDGGFRLFLSHKTEVKKQTAELKDRLATYGISCFVAHEDILPTKAWQDEIENALSSMDGFVALMTENFHDSNWTDQEVGFAVCREVPLIAIKLGIDPYGFIGKFQALSATWETAPKAIVRVLIKQELMLNAYIAAVKKCTQFSEGNLLAEFLPDIERLSDLQADALISAFNENQEVNGSFGFNGAKVSLYGNGLLKHLSRLNSRTYKETSEGKIKVVMAK
jgi:hypothetical protein